MARIRVLLGLSFSLVLAACSRPSPTGVALDSAVEEPSGWVESPVHDDVFWVHGDSGNGNWLFAVDAKGKLLARYRVAGAANVDWEDITHDDQGRLWLGDIGNNDGNRRDLTVHRLPEPDPHSEGVGEVRVELSVPFHFPDQKNFGERPHNFDAEALMWWRDSLWLFSKHRADNRTKLYRFPRLEDGEEVELELVEDFDLGASLSAAQSRFPGQATAADLSADGRHWALLSYDAAFVFQTPESGVDLFGELVQRIEFDPKVLRQVEALAWDGEALLICNEERAVFRIEDPLTQTKYPK